MAKIDPPSDSRCCLFFPGRCVTRARLIGAIVFGLWNNACTLYNARTLYQKVPISHFG